MDRYPSHVLANVLFCRDEVCRITAHLAGGPRLKMRTSEPRDRAPWTLAASVPQAGIDYGAWSPYRGNPHAYPPIWRKSWQVWLSFPPSAEPAILRFAFAYPGAYFSLPFAGDAGKRAFQAGPELLCPPGGLEMMPAQAARKNRPALEDRA